MLGFIVARDRYFVMDLQRRLGRGTLSALLGDVALENDIESRMNGITYVADRLVEHLSPEMGAYLDAVAAGINAYIAAVDAGQASPERAARRPRPAGGAREVDLMHPWDRRDLAAMVAVVMYETTFETGDVGRQRAADSLAGLFSDPETFEAELRRTGYLADIWDDVSPHLRSDSTPGLGVETAAGFTPGPLPARGAGMRPGARRALPASVLALADTLEAFEHRLGRDRDKGFGSNAWAVAGSATADGAALLAGDGHLQLSAPPLMYQVGLDTRTLGGDAIQQAGLLLTGLPVLAVGTNGRVAWSQVNPVLDITDWYQESLRLGADGRPDASFFRGEWRPLVAVDEAYAIADVPALDSVGRDEIWTRYTTFDGRFIVTIEGRPVGEAPPGPGEAAVMTLRGPVVPADLDASGTIDAISFDYAAFDATNYLDTLDRLGFVDDVESFRQATRGLVGSGLFSAAADQHGDVLFSSYQAVPCRGYLARDAEGHWLPGADPASSSTARSTAASGCPWWTRHRPRARPRGRPSLRRALRGHAPGGEPGPRLRAVGQQRSGGLTNDSRLDDGLVSMDPGTRPAATPSAKADGAGGGRGA
ncbi:MAG: penicillin acylase family protein [bacterium]